MKIIMVGDSTSSKFNDVSYYYPRYGYATMLEKYFDVDVLNLSLSGRSSKSFLKEENYNTYLNSIEKGDYIFIGFGHNDEKEDDIARFTSANLPIDDPKSFSYSLYEYYIKPALNKGAIPILCTPIVRLSLDGDYTGSNIHICKNGDYRKCIIDLAEKLELLYIDLTTKTKELFEQIGVEKSILHHAITKAIKNNGKLYPNTLAVDKAHLNIFGAKYCAYFIAEAIDESNLLLRKSIISLSKPREMFDLIVNPEYKFYEYAPPRLSIYNPIGNFTIKNDLYGSAFGNLDLIPNSKNSSFYAYDKNDKFIVGENKNYGGFCASSDGFAFMFKQIDCDDNFKISANAKIIYTNPSKQASFGLMIRDDAYIYQTVNKFDITNNFIAAGILCFDESMMPIFEREAPTELKYYGKSINGLYKELEEASFEIERLGQSITVKTVFRGKEYVQTFLDFDLFAIDSKYYYCGMYATKNTMVEFSDVKYEITGKAMEA